MGYKEILDKLKKIQEESKEFYKSRTDFKKIMKQCDTPSGYSGAKNLLNTCDTDTLERLSRDFRVSVKNSETSDSLFINISLGIVALFLVLFSSIQWENEMSMSILWGFMKFNEASKFWFWIAILVLFIIFIAIYFPIIVLSHRGKYDQWFYEDVVDALEDILESRKDNTQVAPHEINEAPKNTEPEKPKESENDNENKTS